MFFFILQVFYVVQPGGRRTVRAARWGAADGALGRCTGALIEGASGPGSRVLPAWREERV